MKRLLFTFLIIAAGINTAIAQDLEPCDFYSGQIEPLNVMICSNDSFPKIASRALAEGKGIAYRWEVFYEDMHGENSYTNTIAGATGAEFTPPATNIAGYYTYIRYVSDGACEERSGYDAMIYVRPALNTGAINTDGQVVCHGASALEIKSVSGAEGDGQEQEEIVYQWIKITEGKQEETTIEENTLSYTPADTEPGKYTYFREAKDASCVTENWIRTGGHKLTVHPEFNAGSIAVKGDTVCFGVSTGEIGNTALPQGDDNIVYQWIKIKEGKTGEEKITSNSPTYQPTGIETQTPGKFTYYREVKGTSCNNETWARTSTGWKLTVHPVFNPGSIAIKEDTACLGGNAGKIESAVHPVGDDKFSYRWIRVDVQGSTLLITSDTQEYTANTINGDVGTFTYYREVKGATCNNEVWMRTAAGCKLTILPEFNPGSIEVKEDTVCLGGTADEIENKTLPAGDNKFTYRWIKITDGVEGEEIIESDTETYTPTLNAGTYTYYREVKGISCHNETWARTAGSWKLTVLPDFTAGSIATKGDTVCFGDEADEIKNMEYPAGGGGKFTYQWIKIKEGKTDEEIITSNSPVYKPTRIETQTPGKFAYFREVKGVCKKEWKRTEMPWKLTVYPDFNPGAIAAKGDTACFDGAAGKITSAVLPAGDDKFTYQWIKITAGVTSEEIIDANEPEYTPADTQIPGKYTYYREVKGTFCNNETWTRAAGSWKLTVHPELNPGSITTKGDTACFGGNAKKITSAVLPAGDDKFTYQWIKITDGAAGEEVIDTDRPEYTPAGTLTPGKFTYFREVKGTSCHKESWVRTMTGWELTVHPELNAGSIATKGDTVCLGGAADKIANITLPKGDDKFTYRWIKITDGIEGEEIIDTNRPEYTPDNTQNVGAYTYYREVKGLSCHNDSWTRTAADWKLTVLPDFTAGSIAQKGDTVCFGGNADEIGNITFPAGGGDNFTYQWIKVKAGETDEEIITSNTPVYKPTRIETQIPGKFTYFREVKGVCKKAEWKRTEMPWKLTVHPELNPGSIATKGDTVCFGGNAKKITSAVLPKGDDKFTYQWIKITDGAAGEEVIDTDRPEYTPAGTLTPGKFTYFREVKGTSCHKESWVRTMTGWELTVHPELNAGSIATKGDTACFGGNAGKIASAVLPAGDDKFTYQWIKITAGIEGEEIIETNEPEYTPVDTQTPGKFTYFREVKGTTCNNETWMRTGSRGWQLTVHPEFNAGSIAVKGDTACFGGDTEKIGNITLPAGDDKFTYQWIKITAGIEGEKIIDTNRPEYTPDTQTPGKFTYFREVKGTSCHKENWARTGTGWELTVRPELNAGAIATKGETVCFGGDAGKITSAVLPAGDDKFTYQWIKITGGGVEEIIDTDRPEYTPVDTQTPGKFTYYREVKGTTCNNETWMRTEAPGWQLTVHPEFNAGSIAVKGDTPPAGDDRFTYQWIKITNTNEEREIIEEDTPAYTPTETQIPGTFTYYREVKGLSCHKDSWVRAPGGWELTVHPEFNAGSIAGKGDSVCYSEAAKEITSIALPTGDDKFTYQWIKIKEGETKEEVIESDTETYTPAEAERSDGKFTYYREVKGTSCHKDNWARTGTGWELTVHPEFTPGSIILESINICPEEAFSIQNSEAAFGGAGTPIYQWIKSKNGVVVDTIHTNSSSLVSSESISGTFTYIREARSEKCESDTSWHKSKNSFRVAVWEPFEAGTIVDKYGSSGTETVCMGGAPQEINGYEAYGSNALTYQWRWKKEGEHNKEEVIPGATGLTYTPSQNNVAGRFIYYRYVRDEICNSDWVRSKGMWQLTVLDSISAGSIQIPEEPETVCFGAQPGTIHNLENAGGGSNRFDYRWKKWEGIKKGEGIERGVLREIITSDTLQNSSDSGYLLDYTPKTDTAGTFIYTREIRDKACGIWQESAGEWNLTVLPEFFQGAIADKTDSVRINGTPIEIEIIKDASGGSGRFAYQWIMGNNLIKGDDAQKATYTPTDNKEVGSFYYYREAMDSICHKEWKRTENPWALKVFTDLSVGSIDSTGQTVCLNAPCDTIRNIESASGGDSMYDYYWERNGERIAYSNDPTYIPNADRAGTFVYKRWTKDKMSKEWSLSKGSWTLVVRSLPEVSFTQSTNSVCKNQQDLVYEVQLADTSKKVIYEWKIKDEDNGTMSSATDNPVTISWGANVSNTVLSVMVTDTVNGCKYTASQPIDVLPYDAPVLNNLVAKINSEGMPYILIYPKPLETYSYQWYCEGNMIDGATGQFYYPVELDKEYKVYVANLQSKSCGNYTNPYTVSLSTNLSMGVPVEWFSIYPNPSGGRFTITFNKDIVEYTTGVTVNLISSQGTSITQRKVSCSEKAEFNENLENGTYLLQIQDDNGLIMETKQLIIKK